MPLPPDQWTTSPPGIQIRDLHFAYGPGKAVLDGLHLTVRPGAKVALLGASGAGKSTFLLHLNGIHLPQRGSVHIGDVAVAKETLAAIRQRVGLVFQEPDDQLFHLTVEEDVSFGPRNFGLDAKDVAERVQEALASMQLNGFEKRVNQHLSFGERRRVSLATVFAMRPQVLVLDEPFANLDPPMVHSLMETIRAFPGTVLLASQDVLPALGCCNEVAVLHQGRMAAQGPVKDIAQDRKLLRRCGVDFWYLAEVLRSLS
jgi:cobalt/nickel transport system ATP-binding protein